MRIEKLSAERVKEATELYISVFSQEPWHEVYDSVEEVENFIRSFLHNETYVHFILLQEDQMVGLCLGMKKPWLKGMEYYIDEFCVETKLQGQGVGSAFLYKIEEEISLLGMNSILLNTEQGFPSERFYLKNGFKQISRLIVLGK